MKNKKNFYQLLSDKTEKTIIRGYLLGAYPKEKFLELCEKYPDFKERNGKYIDFYGELPRAVEQIGQYVEEQFIEKKPKITS